MRITDHTRDECVVSGDGVCLALGGEEYRHPEAFLGVAGVAGVDVFQVSVSPADLHPVTDVNASVEQGQDNGNGQQAVPQRCFECDKKDGCRHENELDDTLFDGGAEEEGVHGHHHTLRHQPPDGRTVTRLVLPRSGH